MSQKNSNLKDATLTGMFWRFGEKCSAQLVSFVVSIVLARLLTPSDYGNVALITVITSILQVFVDSGMGNALIQKKNADDTDFSSVFYFNMLMCTVLYILLFLSAPLIAAFYNDDILIWPIRIMGLILIISGVKNIQQAYVSKYLLFKKFFYATLGGTVFSAVVGIAMAYQGFGVWALIAQQLSNAAIDTVILLITVKWRPTRAFSLTRLKGLLSYGWKLLAASLINTIYNDIRQLIIGKVYSSDDLAYYNKGKQFPNMIIANLNTSIDSVLLPVMSKAQDERDRVKTMTRYSVRVSGYVIWPMMFGLIAVSKPLITLLLTEKWSSCIPFMCIFCLALGFQPLQSANLNAIKAMGRSDIFLKLEIIKKSIGFLIIALTVNFGTITIALGVLLYNFIASIINSYPNRKLLHYSYIEQLRDILPYILLSAVMCAITWSISLLELPNIVCLLIQVPVGAAIYILGSKSLKFEIFDFLMDTVKDIISKHLGNLRKKKL